MILADESTGALDSDSSSVVLDLLISAAADHGAALLVVTHDEGIASRLSRTVRLKDGRVIAGTPAAEG